MKNTVALFILISSFCFISSFIRAIPLNNGRTACAVVYACESERVREREARNQ